MYPRIHPLPVACEQPEPPLRVEDVTRGRVVQRVFAGRLARNLRVIHAKILRDLDEFRSVRGTQTDERRAKRRYIFAQQRRRIASGIDSDHQHLNALTVIAEFLQRLREFSKRGRTDIRAMDIAEKHYDAPA